MQFQFQVFLLRAWPIFVLPLRYEGTNEGHFICFSDMIFSLVVNRTTILNCMTKRNGSLDKNPSSCFSIFYFWEKFKIFAIHFAITVLTERVHDTEPDSKIGFIGLATSSGRVSPGGTSTHFTRESSPNRSKKRPIASEIKE